MTALNWAREEAKRVIQRRSARALLRTSMSMNGTPKPVRDVLNDDRKDLGKKADRFGKVALRESHFNSPLSKELDRQNAVELLNVPRKFTILNDLDRFIGYFQAIGVCLWYTESSPLEVTMRSIELKDPRQLTSMRGALRNA